MDSIQDLMVELDGADAETVNRIAWQKGSLPVRVAMLGLAAIRKETSPLWFGYPPGVFISYKWAGQSTRDLVLTMADHVRGLGYRAFLDLENLDEDGERARQELAGLLSGLDAAASRFEEKRNTHHEKLLARGQQPELV